MKNVHGENADYDYMVRFREVIDNSWMELGVNSDGWVQHPKNVPDKIDEKYKVMLKDGTQTEDYFTGFNWYDYDYTEIIAFKPI